MLLNRILNISVQSRFEKKQASLHPNSFASFFFIYYVCTSCFGCNKLILDFDLESCFLRPHPLDNLQLVRLICSDARMVSVCQRRNVVTANWIA